MAEIQLVLSERFSAQDADTLRANLREHLAVGEPQWLLRKSADPNISALIQMIGSATDWLPLKAAATAYLSRLAIHAADATRDAVQARFKSEEVKPLADTATALATAANKIERKTEIVLGLNIPDDHFGTCISIEVGEPEEIARHLASLILQVETISEEMQAEIAAGRRPVGGVRIQMCDDGGLLITWQRGGDGKVCEKRIP